MKSCAKYSLALATLSSMDQQSFSSGLRLQADRPGVKRGPVGELPQARTLLQKKMITGSNLLEFLKKCETEEDVSAFPKNYQNGTGVKFRWDTCYHIFVNGDCEVSESEGTTLYLTVSGYRIKAKLSDQFVEQWSQLDNLPESS